MNVLFQLYCEKERLADDQFDQLKSLVDIGDIVGATGSIKRTEKGNSFDSISYLCLVVHFSERKGNGILL